MINVLVVEDQGGKASRIEEVLAGTILNGPLHVKLAGSAHEAAAALRNGPWDLMILDLSIPTRAGEEPKPDGGADFLAQVQGRREYALPTHVVGLTAYSELASGYDEFFADLTWTILYFDITSDRWAHSLRRKLLHIAASKAVEEDGHFDYDVALVTALEDPELRAVLDLEAGWRTETVAGDDTIYSFGEFPGPGGPLRVVAAASIQMGMPAAAGLAMKMCIRFRPRYLGMCGIAAGVGGGFGDVLIAERTWDYGSGKSKGNAKTHSDGTPFGAAAFEPAPVPLPLDPGLDAKFKRFCTDAKVLREIEVDWPGDLPKTRLATKMGPIASGAAVLENRPLLDAIKTHDRKLVGVEMEAYAVFMAARICPAPRPKAFVIKSVCDFADSRKKDAFQRYAAYTSAQFMYRFVCGPLFGPISSSP